MACLAVRSLAAWSRSCCEMVWVLSRFSEREAVICASCRLACAFLRSARVCSSCRSTSGVSISARTSPSFTRCPISTFQLLRYPLVRA